MKTLDPWDTTTYISATRKQLKARMAEAQKLRFLEKIGVDIRSIAVLDSVIKHCEWALNGQIDLFPKSR